MDGKNVIRYRLISKIHWKQGPHQRNDIENLVLLSLFMTSN